MKKPTQQALRKGIALLRKHADRCGKNAAHFVTFGGDPEQAKDSRIEKIDLDSVANFLEAVARQ